LNNTNSGSQFSAVGRVVNQAKDGIGVEFIEIGPADQARLEECLSELAVTEKIPAS
jgi:hypothetical protein